MQLIQQLSVKKAAMASLNTVQVISEIIKRIKKSFGSERDEILNSVKYHFQMEQDEKWVVTKLRMILFRMKGGIETFQLNESKNQKKRKAKSKRQSRSLPKRKRQSTRTEKTSSSTPKSLKTQIKAKRLTLEEKQLNKLRQQTFPEKKKTNFPSSKLAYLKAYGLEPTVIYL